MEDAPGVDGLVEMGCTLDAEVDMMGLWVCSRD